MGGGVGSGKTYILSALVNELCNIKLAGASENAKTEANSGRLIVKIPARFITHIELLESIRPNSDNNINKNMLIYKNTPLLVIDDLGAARNTDWKEEKLFEIVDYRYNNVMPTLFTTNLTKEELKINISNRTFDRLIEMCDFIGVTTPSQRTYK